MHKCTVANCGGIVVDGKCENPHHDTFAKREVRCGVIADLRKSK